MTNKNVIVVLKRKYSSNSKKKLLAFGLIMWLSTQAWHGKGNKSLLDTSSQRPMSGVNERHAVNIYQRTFLPGRKRFNWKTSIESQDLTYNKIYNLFYSVIKSLCRSVMDSGKILLCYWRTDNNVFFSFFRKNCTSCKCPREAHDVCHEEWVSVRSRLGLKGDESNGPIGVDPRERGLAWAPPGLPSHKVNFFLCFLYFCILCKKEY